MRQLSKLRLDELLVARGPPPIGHRPGALIMIWLRASSHGNRASSQPGKDFPEISS